MGKNLASIEQLQQEAAHFIQTLEPNTSGATLVTLSGELGAGKTTFTQSVARALGISDTITSPTFVIEKIYPVENDTRFDRFIHIDAYRLKDITELHAVGFDDVIANPKNLIFLEWPEKVPGVQATNAITLSVNEDMSRDISYA